MNNHGIKNLHGTKFAGLCFTIMICAYIVIAFIGQTLLHTFDGKQDLVYFIVNALFSVLAMEIVIRIANFDRHEFISLEHYFKKSSPKYFLFSTVFAAGMFLGLGFSNTLIADAVERLGGTVSHIQLPLDSPLNLCIFTIFYALLPAVEEEAFFRGLLRENMRANNKWVTALVIATVFGLYHCSIAKFFYQFVYGFGLSIIAIKCGSALPTMVAHFINNFAILLLSYLKVEIDFFNPFVIAIGIILLALFTWFIIFDFHHAKHETKDHDEKYFLKDFWFPFGLVGSGICLIVLLTGLVSH